MKIYFTTSARGEKQIEENCKQIHEIIEKLGHSHLDHFFDDMNTQKVYEGSFKSKKKRYLDALKHIRSADAVILEVSTHSLTMGYLLNMALDLNKPVILLHIEGHLPAFAEGIENNKLQIWEYSTRDIKGTLKESLEIAKKESNIRYNLFLNQDQYLYLQQLADKGNRSKSEVIRELIDTHRTTT